ncbi:MAG: sigma-70 family RNA polymerase sigma factor [Planctomycetes bacterium]|nr:sigma-70 family RNA polymerase sigma factor [Planctomycetota bacterium]
MSAQRRPEFQAEPAPLAEASDEVLMVRVAEGDSGAYETLYQRYKSRILTFVMRYVGDRDWAEDLCQETFLRLYRNPRAFDPRNRFSTWLFTVARNLAIDFLRRKRPATSIDAGEDGDYRIEPAGPEAERPVDRTLMRELERRVQDNLNALSDKLREVFILCAMQGLSYEEVAQIVGCPAKTVSSRLARARERFAQSFDPYLAGKERRKP